MNKAALKPKRYAVAVRSKLRLKFEMVVLTLNAGY